MKHRPRKQHGLPTAKPANALEAWILEKIERAQRRTRNLHNSRRRTA